MCYFFAYTAEETFLLFCRTHGAQRPMTSKDPSLAVSTISVAASPAFARDDTGKLGLTSRAWSMYLLMISFWIATKSLVTMDALPLG